MPDTETNKLNRLLATQPELQALAQKDASVHAWFAMVYAGRCTVDQALIGLVIAVTKEKRAYFNMVVKLKSNAEGGKLS